MNKLALSEYWFKVLQKRHSVKKHSSWCLYKDKYHEINKCDDCNYKEEYLVIDSIKILQHVQN